MSSYYITNWYDMENNFMAKLIVLAIDSVEIQR